MVGSILGNRVRRVEDPDLLLGHGTYVDNLRVEGMLHLAFVRSPIAHGRIRDIDVSAAADQPGVVAVYTATDLGVPAHHGFMVLNEKCPRPPLAESKVRFVGEAVAVVVAESRAAAVDGAELVDVDYEPLAAVSDPERAVADGAPLQFEELGTNVAGGLREPDGADPLGDAEVVVRARINNQRLAVVPMEGNAIAVVPGDDGNGHDLTVHVSTQMPHGFHGQLAGIFGLSPEKVRVLSPHVGGGFGGKAGVTAEHSVAVAVARKLARPVKWVESRSENMIAMPHGRGQIQYAEMGLKRDGTITGLRVRLIGDAGAYAGFGGALAIGPSYMMAQGVYRIPKLGFDVAAALTNTTPTGAYRGAGRPEAAALLERIIDMAADELDIDPAEIRRRNFLRPDDFPFTTLTGTRYDTGDYDAPLTEALRLVGYKSLRAEQEERRTRGDRKLLGIGIATYVEITAFGGEEYASVEIHDDGSATVMAGTSAHGQGHATSYAMIVADQLGIPVERVRFLQSDTAAIPRGGGTGGSRSLQLGGSAVRRASATVLQQARELAASLLEANVDDIVVSDDGQVGVAGVPSQSLSWSDLARNAAEQGGSLSAALDFEQKGATFPFGAHVSVVEVDTETGRVDVRRHVAVDDCGRVLNPLIVEGQQHGGIAQGIAQALWEQYIYDSDGNPQTTNLADYAMPSAAEFPSFEVGSTETPTDLNPLGVKGIGEAPTIGSTPAVQNAVVDALSHLGVRHIDMPCSPARVWQTIQDARAGRLADPWREPPSAFATLPVRGESAEPEAAGADI